MIKQIPDRKQAAEVFKAINFLIRNMYYTNSQIMRTKTDTENYKFFKKIHGKEDANLMCAFFKYVDDGGTSDPVPYIERLYKSYKSYVNNYTPQILLIENANDLGFYGESLIKLLITNTQASLFFPAEVDNDTVVFLINEAKDIHDKQKNDKVNYSKMEIEM
jgi:hypothetical protein